jgi:lipoprotein signal peptidase
MTTAEDVRIQPHARRARRQLMLFGAIVVAVVAVDQAAKAVAWRHLSGSLINRGGFYFLGDTVRGWFAHPVVASLGDGVGWVLIGTAAWWLLRTRRGGLVFTGMTLVIAGFASNLADRLGLHDITAPGSARGVVDFIPSGDASRSNVADVVIALGAVLLVISCGARRRAAQPRQQSQHPEAQSPRRA